MLKNECGSNDGIIVSKFLEGVEYNVPRDISLELANVFIEHMKCAEEVKQVIPKVNPVEIRETKVIEPVEIKEDAKVEVKKSNKSNKQTKKKK